MSSESLRRAGGLLDGCGGSEEGRCGDGDGPLGGAVRFVTGSGRVLQPSESSLRGAKALLASVAGGFADGATTGPSRGGGEEASSAGRRCDGGRSGGEQQMEVEGGRGMGFEDRGEAASDTATSVPMLMTGSGRTLKVSSESLRRAGGLLDGCVPLNAMVGEVLVSEVAPHFSFKNSVDSDRPAIQYSEYTKFSSPCITKANEDQLEFQEDEVKGCDLCSDDLCRSDISMIFHPVKSMAMVFDKANADISFSGKVSDFARISNNVQYSTPLPTKRASPASSVSSSILKGHALSAKITPKMYISSDDRCENISPAILFRTSTSENKTKSASCDEFLRRANRICLKAYVGGSLPFEDEGNGNISIEDYSKIVAIRSCTASDYQLDIKNSRYFSACSSQSHSSHTVCAVDMHRALLLDEQVSGEVAESWVLNHYRWIIWKYASMERAFPTNFGGKLLTADRVFEQLKMRYQCEFSLSKSSFLKRLIEKDELPTRHVVLCVSGIASAHEKLPSTENSDRDIYLTDGWYEVGAVLDSHLKSLLCSGKIFVGLKLHIKCSKILSTSQGKGNILLGLSINNCRRAEWDTKLGIQKASPTFLIKVKSIVPGGGMAPAINVIVCRVFPLVWMESCLDGKKIWRSLKAEERAREEFENGKLIELQKYMETKLGSNFDCDEIFYGDSSENTTGINQKRNLFADQVNAVREEFVKENSERGQRNVCAVLKVKVACLNPCSELETRAHSCYVTFWRPSSDITYEIKEGKQFTFFNLDVGNSRRNGLVCLSFTKSSYLKRSNEVQTERDIPRSILRVEDLRKVQAGEEFDVAGIILASSPVVQVFRVDGSFVSRQTLMLCGLEGTFLAVDIDLRCLPSPSRSLDLHGPLVMLSKNLERLTFSDGAGIFRCTASEFSELVIDPTCSNEDISSLKQWLRAEKDQITDLCKRAKHLLNV